MQEFQRVSRLGLACEHFRMALPSFSPYQNSPYGFKKNSQQRTGESCEASPCFSTPLQVRNLEVIAIDRSQAREKKRRCFAGSWARSHKTQRGVRRYDSGQMIFSTYLARARNPPVKLVCSLLCELVSPPKPRLALCRAATRMDHEMSPRRSHGPPFTESAIGLGGRGTLAIYPHSAPL